jgi:hypothetical protein
MKEAFGFVRVPILHEQPRAHNSVMSGRILPSRVSTTFTLVKTSACADSSSFDRAQMHEFKQRKAGTNMRIPDPANQQKKQLAKLMTEQKPSQRISRPRFRWCVREHYLSSVQTITSRSHSNPRSCLLGLTCWDLTGGVHHQVPHEFRRRSQTARTKCRCNFSNSPRI